MQSSDDTAMKYVRPISRIARRATRSSGGAGVLAGGACRVRMSAPGSTTRGDSSSLGSLTPRAIETLSTASLTAGPPLRRSLLLCGGCLLRLVPRHPQVGEEALHRRAHRGEMHALRRPLRMRRREMRLPLVV